MLRGAKQLSSVHDQDGISIVEIVVGLLLSVFVIGAIVATTGAFSTIHAQQSARVEAATVGKAVWARVRSDATWTQDCKVSCTIPQDVYASVSGVSDLLDGGGTIVATAEGVDSASDGTVAAGTDKDAPDFFKVTLTVTPNTESRTKPIVFSGIVNPTRSGVGQLTVQVCAVYPQVDERINFSNCDTKTRVSITPPPAESEAAVIKSWDAAPSWTHRTFVTPSAAGTQVTISGPQTRTMKTNGAGKASFDSLQVGTYKISVKQPGSLDTNMVRWDSHSIPTEERVNVDAGQKVNAVWAFRPAKVRMSIQYRTSRYWGQGPGRPVINDIPMGPDCTPPPGQLSSPAGLNCFGERGYEWRAQGGSYTEKTFNNQHEIFVWKWGPKGYEGKDIWLRPVPVPLNRAAWNSTPPYGDGDKFIDPDNVDYVIKGGKFAGWTFAQSVNKSPWGPGVDDEDKGRLASLAEAVWVDPGLYSRSVLWQPAGFCGSVRCPMGFHRAQHWTPYFDQTADLEWFWLGPDFKYPGLDTAVTGVPGKGNYPRLSSIGPSFSPGIMLHEYKCITEIIYPKTSSNYRTCDLAAGSEDPAPLVVNDEDPTA